MFQQQFREDFPCGLKIKSYKALFIVLLIMNAKDAFWAFCVASVASPVTHG